MDGEQLLNIVNGLKKNQLLEEIDYVVTGYIGSASFLSAIQSVLLQIKQQKETQVPQRPKLYYVCDPVLGDDGKLYVPKELVSLYRTEIIPLADIVTPNQFEVEQLTGIVIHTLDDAKRACSCFHDMGPPIVFLTSLEINETENEKEDMITVFASQRRTKRESTATASPSSSFVDEYYSIHCPKIKGSYTGTGDLTAALILGHWDKHPDNLPVVMEKVVNTMQVVIQRTKDVAMKINPDSTASLAKSRELQLIQSKRDIENPPSTYRAVKVE
eukprot:scaffold24339_cov122-Cylindrotheca_fusiformis.AAC.2